MRRRATIASALVLTAATALGLPAGAAATPGYYVVPRSHIKELTLRASNGFLMVVAASRHAVSVTAWKKLPHSGTDVVSYQLVHRQAEDGLNFNLGREGAFHLRFIAGKSRELPLDGCKGEPSVIEQGIFVGTIDFHGSRGFTHVEARKAHGTITTQGHQLCRRWTDPGNDEGDNISTTPSWPPKPRKGEVQLLAGRKSGRLEFQAISLGTEEEFFRSRFFSASTHRYRHGVEMFSTVSISTAPAASFRTPEPGDPTSAATVEPPAPFSGSARFALTSPTHATFRGDLAVELAGFGRVSLTRGSLYAGICDEEGCSKTLPKRRP